jgi:DNA invertase Pin-like site-specific DNA recombinase
MPSADQHQPLAYSYIRFSRLSQAPGDSVRRQTEDAQGWCQRNGLRLDESTTLRDLGRSAFRGKHRTNPDKHALAAFLQLVEQGKVPRGSYLIIENLDRLSREDERSALRLWMDILDRGVNIVQLHPETVFRHEKSDMMDIMRAIIELSRGHGESARKSERNGAAWEKRRRLVRKGEGLLTHRLPGWVEKRGDRLVAIPERAAAVRRIFELASAGYGAAGIVKKLTAESVPSFGPSGHWARTYVATILRDRRALGELQPRRADGEPDGEPIPGYFPAVVTEAEWLAARASTERRRGRSGRQGSHVNVFAGLLRDALDGDTYYASTRSSARYGTRWRVLLNTASADGRAPTRSFPFEPFERGVLSLLREVDPREILGEGDEPDEVRTLATDLDGVQARIAALEAELLEGDVPSLTRVLRTLEARRQELAGKLDEVRERATNPLSTAWDEARGLMRMIDEAADPTDTRIRLRSILRRTVESVWLLPVARGRDRLLAVQVGFAGGERQRSYLILNRPPMACTDGRVIPGGWWARSFAEAAIPGGLDLRDREQAKRLESVLTEIDTVDLAGTEPG